MALLLAAVAILVVSGLTGLWRPRSAVWGLVCACLLGLIPAVRVLLGSATETIRLPWAVPYASFFVQIDPLSAFFLVPIFGISALTAVYGEQYLVAWRGKKNLGVSWLFFNLLIASLVLVVLARNAILFLFAWELITLTSFFLVTFEDEHETVRAAGWTYFIASHLGTAFLLVLFILLGRQSGSLDFDQFHSVQASVLFVLAIVGFGTKAGFMPFHVWLPEAHPAAPSHVSALMSGVMIKMGIYGLVRTLTFLGPPPLWWGWLLVAIGLSSGVFGVLFALAQHDLKRLLAYHSVENIGIIALGLGAGLLGLSTGSTGLALLGFAGALLHVVNHALFKSLLFLGAGAVVHATGTRELEHLGGLGKRMPWTSAAFLVGAVAICGFPPLNGFISEFFIYFGSFTGAVHGRSVVAVPLWCVIGGLGLIGGLAAACFSKAFGIVFLGEPRHQNATRAHEVGLAMRLPMILLAAGCLAIGLMAPFLVTPLSRVLSQLTQLPQTESWADTLQPLHLIVSVSLVLFLVIAVILGLRKLLFRGRSVRTAVTWDCGYATPTARMQYTASSFAQPLTELFQPLLQTRRMIAPPAGMFPKESSLETVTTDVSRDFLFRPLFLGIAWGLGRLRWLQQGRIQLYILYIAVTLLVLLIWKLS